MSRVLSLYRPKRQYACLNDYDTCLDKSKSGSEPLIRKRICPEQAVKSHVLCLIASIVVQRSGAQLWDFPIYVQDRKLASTHQNCCSQTIQ